MSSVAVDGHEWELTPPELAQCAPGLTCTRAGPLCDAPVRRHHM